MPVLNCEIHFGVSGLENSSLMDQFYPADLPEDWRLSYYSNEFSSIVVKLSDIDADLSMSEGSISAAITELLEEIDGEDFVLLFDLSELPANTKQALQSLETENRDFAKANSYYIDLQAMLIETLGKDSLLKEKTPENSLTFQWGDINGNLLCYVQDNQAIEPVMLKKLLEIVRQQAKNENIKSAIVIFSSAQNALQNCRNAIVLERMM